MNMCENFLESFDLPKRTKILSYLKWWQIHFKAENPRNTQYNFVASKLLTTRTWKICGGADTSLARPTSRCRRTGSIV